MKKNNIRKIAMLIALSQALTFTGCKNTIVLNDDNREEYEYNVPNGFHMEEDAIIVKNPEGLVDASFAPEQGYHLEAYEYDDNLFYVVPDGCHVEDGHCIPDGYHLEKDKVVKDSIENDTSNVLKSK